MIHFRALATKKSSTHIPRDNSVGIKRQVAGLVRSPWVKALDTMPEHLSWALGTYMVEKEIPESERN